MLKHIAWKDVEAERLNPLLDRQMITGEEIMLARVLLKEGCVVPEHSHHNEQLTYILEGALKFWIDGREIVVRAGQVLCIPPHMPHKAEAIEDTVDLDVFHPPRQDWLDKSDAYLRGSADSFFHFSGAQSKVRPPASLLRIVQKRLGTSPAWSRCAFSLFRFRAAGNRAG